MKKLMLTGVSLLFTIALTFAQAGSPEEKAKMKMAKISEKLMLTPAQQTSVYDIVLEHTKAKWTLKSDTTIMPAIAKQQALALAAGADTKIAEQLTAEQKPLYTKYVEERDAKKKNK